MLIDSGIFTYVSKNLAVRGYNFVIESDIFPSTFLQLVKGSKNSVMN